MKDMALGWADKFFAFAQLDLLIVSILIGLFGFALLRVQRQVRFECRRREESDRQLLNALQRITHLEDLTTTTSAANTPAHVPSRFGHDLNHAELKTRLQSPLPTGNAPDKYRHVASLAAQGMSVEQIAEVLNISLPEANQLVSLSRLAQR